MIIAAAALCHLGIAAGPEEALAAVIAARPKARPSKQQRAALERFVRGECPSNSPPTGVTDSLS